MRAFFHLSPKYKQTFWKILEISKATSTLELYWIWHLAFSLYVYVWVVGTKTVYQPAYPHTYNVNVCSMYIYVYKCICTLLIYVAKNGWNRVQFTNRFRNGLRLGARSSGYEVLAKVRYLYLSTYLPTYTNVDIFRLGGKYKYVRYDGKYVILPHSGEYVRTYVRQLECFNISSFIWLMRRVLGI